MPNNWKNKIIFLLVGAFISGFSGLCIKGYFYLDSKASAHEIEEKHDHLLIKKESLAGDEKVLAKVDKKLEKLEKKMDVFQEKQIKMQLDVGRILEGIKYLKEKAK